MTLSDIKAYLMDYDGEDVTIMEVCGSHTGAIARFGIPDLLSPKIHLLSGPGCPVCVTPSSYIDRLIALSKEPQTVVATFGDLLRVPGSVQSLSEAKGEGADVEMVYSPLDVLAMARKNPTVRYVFAAVGFETTTPVYAALLDAAVKEGCDNIRLLCALKTMPGVISHLMTHGAAIDGFLAPGHVSVVTGAEVYRPLAERFCIPFVVAGFRAEELLVALYDLIRLKGQGTVKNDYPSVVTSEGNTAARALVDRYFTDAAATWRGIGAIPQSGKLLKDAYRSYDMGSEALVSDSKRNAACICDQVLMGRKSPHDCPLFGKACLPAHPQGACMVSTEGSCFSYYTYQRV